MKRIIGGIQTGENFTSVLAYSSAAPVHTAQHTSPAGFFSVFFAFFAYKMFFILFSYEPTQDSTYNFVSQDSWIAIGGKGGVIAQLVLGTYLMLREHSQQNNDRRMDYFCTHI